MGQNHGHNEQNRKAVCVRAPDTPGSAEGRIGARPLAGASRRVFQPRAFTLLGERESFQAFGERHVLLTSKLLRLSMQYSNFCKGVLRTP